MGAHYDEPMRSLSEPLRGVRGLLIDLDGVIVLKGQAIPGAPEALAELTRRRIPFRIVTNTSLLGPVSLSRYGRTIGVDIPPDRILSGVSVSAELTARQYPGRPIYVLASDDARAQFDGQRVLTDEEADAPDAAAAAVVVGDAPDRLSHATLNRAFRLVRGGAELIAMHRNPWWLTPDGPTIDSGAIVAGLEFATGVRATLVGKPARAMFTIAAAQVQSEIAARDGGGRVPRSAIAMIGDDLQADVLAAQRAGLRGVLVLTGKHGAGDVTALAARRRRTGRVPDFVAPALADVVAALD
jgi:HAD superfamily hydrolase (TIGR01450 family)